jgi:hypothetical protein
MLRRAFAVILRPVQRLLLRLTPVDDPWERIDVSPALGHLGSGARYEFEWYFQGESAVPVSNLHELRSWLRGCRYVRDPELFHERDYWQHPRTFEQLRRGDCEDFALWAWRKLVELGYDADLVIGSAGEGTESRHAWIVYRENATEYLMEPGHARQATWVRPLDEVRAEYLPMYGVGPDRRRFTFAGYLLDLKQQQTRRQPPPGTPFPAAPDGPLQRAGRA